MTPQEIKEKLQLFSKFEHERDKLVSQRRQLYTEDRENSPVVYKGMFYSKEKHEQNMAAINDLDEQVRKKANVINTLRDELDGILLPYGMKISLDDEYDYYYISILDAD